ncbi:hypothetical protein AD07_1485 [Escherichia coli 8-415-05_S4_C2]|nr:hypothetical protein AD07_1485 [Escherichia coli 8-415-05_S4_C2]
MFSQSIGNNLIEFISYFFFYYADIYTGLWLSLCGSTHVITGAHYNSPQIYNNH